MATKSEHRVPTEGTSKGVNGTLDVHNYEETLNGFDQNGLCYATRSTNSLQGSHASEKKCSTTSGQQQSPSSPTSLRRSTRACALKAAERIKLKETLTPIMDGVASHSGEAYASAEEDAEEPPKKKRYAEGRILDQTDCKFGIKIEDNEVLLMSDESELSSLNEVEYDHVRRAFDKTIHREQTEEKKKEAEVMIKTLEAELRTEEARLSMLRKLRTSQQVSVRQMQEANVRRLTANVAQNGSGTAYRPPVASAQNRTNTSPAKASTSQAQNRAAANAAAAILNNLTPQQQQLLQNAAKNGLLNTSTAHALLQQAQQVQANGRLSQQASALAAAALSQQHHPRVTVPTVTPKESAAQRAAAAKLALRRQLEQQLLQIPPPRPPPPEMRFIPNGTQPDFLYLLGLDIAVQRVLKDKSVVKRVTERPYVCEECGTDFTPVWRAIGQDENSLHLYCEACVKAAQKKKMRQEHTALLRKAFNKVMEKEQELERQIAEGKFDTSMPSSSTPRSSTPAAAATPPLNVSVLKTAPSSSSSAPADSMKTTNSTAGVHHPKSTGHKRAASSNNLSATAAAAAASQNAAAAAAAAIAAAASSGGTSSLLQQQMLAAAALRHTSPMLAAMMANPLLNAPNMLQMQWNPMMQQRLPNLAMAALAQAVQNAQQSGASAGASSTVAAAAAAATNPLAALAATVNPAAAAAMFGNPQVVRQLQQAHQAMQRNFLMEYAKSQSKK